MTPTTPHTQHGPQLDQAQLRLAIGPGFQSGAVTDLLLRRVSARR